MTFLSLPFFCFFPITALGYFCLPRRVKNLWLLLASWFFYLWARPVYLSLLLFVIAASYLTGRLLAGRRRKGVLALCLAVLGVLLFLFKYVNFALSLAGQALGLLGLTVSMPVLELVLPVGISFYLFQAMGYVIDVYRGKAEAQRDFLRYALFLSFFPQVVSGPIARADQLLPQFDRPHPFQWDAFRAGLFRFLWGAFKKMVLADQLAVLVNTVFAAPESYGAVQLAGAAVAFSLQIYCDFSAYSDMALGTAGAMGFTLMENFRTPYFSRSIGEFWRRWHISLSSWFRDYLYIPLGGSRKGRRRKYLNVLIVFAISGLWHGAALSFVVWGLLNGVYQVIGGMTQKTRDRIRRRLGLADNAPCTIVLQVILTFLLSTAAWVFFKAGSFTHSLSIFGAMLTGPWLTRPFSAWGLDLPELVVVTLAVLLLLAVDLFSVLRGSPRQAFFSLPRPARWVLALVLLLSVLIFGVYGTGYDPQDFIYFKF